MMDPFLDTLYELSHLTGLKLYPDHKGACRLKLKNHLVKIVNNLNRNFFLIIILIAKMILNKGRFIV